MIRDSAAFGFVPRESLVGASEKCPFDWNGSPPIGQQERPRISRRYQTEEPLRLQGFEGLRRSALRSSGCRGRGCGCGCRRGRGLPLLEADLLLAFLQE